MANLRTKTLFLLGTLLIQSAFSSYVPKSVIYWGQESDGDESSLATYCSTGSFDVIVIAFVHLFPTASGSVYPGMNFAGHCSKSFNSANKNLLICPAIEADILTCQSKGVQVIISLGGADGTYGFTSDTQASTFADTFWNMFLGGTSGIPRPFGTAILDGVDLDIEKSPTTGYAAFIAQLRTHFVNAPKNYYISSAPQCPYPDEFLGPGAGTALQSAWFDYVWVQFYNNNCGLNFYSKGAFNFNTWGNWATTISVNKNVKVFIGAPAASGAAGEGYVPLATLETITATVLASQYASVFGGIMLWDTSDSDLNNDFGGSVGNYLHAITIASANSVSSTTGTATTTSSTTGAKTSTTGVKTSTTTTSSTTGSKTTTGAKSTTGTTGSKTTTGAKTSTTGAKTSTTGSKTQSTPATTTGESASPATGTCVTGYMQCLTSESYSMCAHSAWGIAQSCPSGTVCSPSGNYIYCVRA